jgi:alkylation response protein AidB-like acyl-CoA dehydrogenase
MKLEETTEDVEFREEIRSWLDGVLPEVWGADAPPTDPSEEEDYATRRRFDKVMYRDGWAGLAWDRDYGGQGRSLRHQIIFSEECERAGAPEVFNRVAVGIIAHAIMLFGTEEQKKRFLPKILSAEEIWCQGFSEPEAGSDLAAQRARAVPTDDGWILNGQKVWTTLAHYADFCFILARTDTEGPRHKGISAFILDLRQEGVEVRPIRQINGDHEFAEVFLTDAFVPGDMILGEPGQGWAIAMGALEYERSTNFMKRQVRLSLQIDELVERCRAHRDSLHSELLDRLTDLMVRSERLRFTVWRSVDLITRTGKPDILNNASKVYWSETQQQLARLALEVEAAIRDGGGVDGDGQHTRRSTDYLSARATTIYAGTSEIQRNIIAERGLGLPR